MSINRVNISGNLTRDTELRTTNGGTAILSFGVAVNDRRKNPQTGEWEDYPNFIDCIMFGTRAESVSRFLHKGVKIAAEGKLRYSSWERDGQRRSKLEVVVEDIEFMSARDGQQAPAQTMPQTYQQNVMQTHMQTPQQTAQQNVMQNAQQTMQQSYMQAPQQNVMQQPQQAYQPSIYDEEIPFS
ncbi:MAG TPA: single-stranded DNA-binding protein [Candidatus Olsenella pullicola]|nr:single-stranded DNA-binding protein [Candidatus Olsenella pullicola]